MVLKHRKEKSLCRIPLLETPCLLCGGCRWHSYSRSYRAPGLDLEGSQLRRITQTYFQIVCICQFMRSSKRMPLLITTTYCVPTGIFSQRHSSGLPRRTHDVHGVIPIDEHCDVLLSNVVCGSFRFHKLALVLRRLHSVQLSGRRVTRRRFCPLPLPSSPAETGSLGLMPSDWSRRDMAQWQY